MAVVVILGLLFGAALLVAAIVVVGLVRSRRQMMWRNPGYNIFTGEWSDERDPGDDEER